MGREKKSNRDKKEVCKYSYITFHCGQCINGGEAGVSADYFIIAVSGDSYTVDDALAIITLRRGVLVWNFLRL